MSKKVASCRLPVASCYLLSAICCLLSATSAYADPAPAAASNDFDVSFEKAEDAINQALTEKGVGDKVSALINGHGSKPIFVYNKPITVETRGLTFDKNSGHWEGNLLFVADGEVVSALAAAGHFDEMVEVAIVKHEIRSGEIIHEGDIEIRDFSRNHIRANTITDLSGLIGKTPLRSLSPFRPIRAEEVVNPAIVKKDAMVEMRYTLPGMNISTTGQTLTAGAKGDVISVRNLTSKKIIRAVVEDSQTVNAMTIGAERAEN